MLKSLKDYNEDEEFDLVLLVKSAQLRQSKKGQHYLDLQLGDESCEIRANYWNCTAETAEAFRVGTVVQVNGQKEFYQDQLQLKLFSLRSVSPDEQVDLTRLVASAPEASSAMKDAIESYVAKITNPVWQQLVRFLLDKWEAPFYDFPAGKINHHAIKGGLAFHTLAMLKDAKALAANYEQVDCALLYAGCILHDMGKVLEFTGPVATQYTVAGNLIGHLVLIDEQIMLAAIKLKLDPESEAVLLLRHMVLSHHGELEYGSPKRPALLEAELLHRIDDLDATVYAVTKALQGTKPGQFTVAIGSQAGRRFYRPQHDDRLAQSSKLY